MTDSIGSTSGVTRVDNTFYQDGKKATVDMLVTNLMTKRVEAVDGLLADLLSEMHDNNIKTTRLNELLGGLRAERPLSENGTVSHENVMAKINDIKQKYGVDPVKDWGVEVPDGDLNQSQVDTMIESIKSKISSVNSNQQMTQIKVEKYNNVRNEAMQLVSTMMKTLNDILQSIIRNIN